MFKGVYYLPEQLAQEFVPKDVKLFLEVVIQQADSSLGCLWTLFQGEESPDASLVVLVVYACRWRW